MYSELKLKYIRTGVALLSYTFQGMNNGLLGPSLMDLAVITGITPEYAASVITWRSAGTLTGLLSSGFIFDRYNEHLLLGLTMMILGITVGVMPWCSQLPLLFAVVSVNGIAQGTAAVGHTGLPVKVWGTEKCGFVLHAFMLATSVGSAAISLILAPFVLQMNELCSYLDNSTDDLYFVSNKSSENVPFLNNSMNNILGQSRCHAPISVIHYGFLILSINLIIVAILHFIIAKKQIWIKEEKMKLSVVDKPIMNIWAVLFIFFIIGFSGGAVNTIHGDIIQPFLIEELGLTVQISAYIISAFWFTQVFGRCAGIFLAKHIAPDKLILLNSLTRTSGVVTMVIFIHYIVATWIATVTIGLGISTERGAALYWLALLIPFRSINNGIYLCGIYTGKAIIPILYDLLFDYCGHMSLFYAELALSGLMLLCVVFLMICVKVNSSKIEADSPSEAETEDSALFDRFHK